MFLRSLLILSFLCTKTGDPFPKITTLRGQETLPCIHSLVAPACSVWGRTISRVTLLDLLICIVVFKASVHPGQSSPGVWPQHVVDAKKPFLVGEALPGLDASVKPL